MTIPAERRGATRLKLEEAKFFLNYLTPNFGKKKKFDFFLSAFLSAARAVLLIMRAEYCKVEGWEAWFDAGELDSKEDELFKGTTKARDRLLKREPLATLNAITVSGPYTDNGDDVDAEKTLARIFQEHVPFNLGGTPGKYSITATLDGQRIKLYVREARFDRQLKEFPGEHIVPLCTRYYDLLAKIVADCEEKFGR